MNPSDSSETLALILIHLKADVISSKSIDANCWILRYQYMSIRGLTVSAARRVISPIYIQVATGALGAVGAVLPSSDPLRATQL